MMQIHLPPRVLDRQVKMPEVPRVQEVLAVPVVLRVLQVLQVLSVQEDPDWTL